ncbi:MAG: arginase family protein [Candidatus Nanohaloarchaea archaeon]
MVETNSPDDTDILVQKIPSDMGIHRNPRKGTLSGPEVLLDDFNFDSKVLVDEVFPDEFDLKETQRRIEENTNDLLDQVKPVLSIGGDHSISFPVVKAVKERYPELQLVWLDSHLDLKEKVDDNISHDVVVRELLEHGFDEDEIWFVGITRIDHDEKEFMEGRDFHVYRADEVGEFFQEFNSNEQPVYLSVDIDVLRANLAPGTGYPDGELELKQVERIIETVRPGHADLVEVAPPLDREGKTIDNGRNILKMLEKALF